MIGLHFCRRLYGSIFIQIFAMGSKRRIFAETECLPKTNFGGGQIAAQGHSRSFILQSVTGRQGLAYRYNIAGLVSEDSEEVAIQVTKNCRRRAPHSHLTPPPRGTPANIPIHLRLSSASHSLQGAQLPQRNSASATHDYLGWSADLLMITLGDTMHRTQQNRGGCIIF